MGVINITHRSASLGNLGGVQMARTDTGAAQMWGSVAKLGNGLMDIGRAGVDIAAMLRDREDQRQVDAFYSRYREAMDRYNVSFDNGQAQGAMQVEFANSEQWLNDNYEFRKTMFDHIAGSDEGGLNLSERQKELAAKRVQGFNESLDRMWANRAADRDRAIEKDNAATAFSDASSLIAFDMTPQNLKDWHDAGVRKAMTLGKVTKEQQNALLAESAKDVLKQIDDGELGRAMEDALAQGEEGGKVYDELLKRDFGPNATVEFTDPETGKKTRYKTPFAMLSKGDQEAHKREWERRVKSEKSTFQKMLEKQKADAEAVRSKNKQAIADATSRGIVQLYTSDKMPEVNPNDPESVKARKKFIASGLAVMGTNKELVAANPQLARSLIESAHRIASSMEDDEARSGDDAFKAEIKLMTRVVKDRNGVEEKINMTPGEALAYATKMHEEKKISNTAFLSALSEIDSQKDDDATKFVSQCCDLVGVGGSVIAWDSRRDQVKLNQSFIPSARRAKGKDAATGIKRMYAKGTLWDDTEDVTYGQLMKCISLVYQQRAKDQQAGRVQDDDYYFKKLNALVQPTVEARRHKKLNERLAVMESVGNVDDLDYNILDQIED